MNILDTGTLARGIAGTPRAMLTFPAPLALANGALLATLRAGSTKDAADEAIELYRSDDAGRSWRMLRRLRFDGALGGARGTLKVCYLTEIAPGRLLAAAMWVDRTTYPGQPLFNPATCSLPSRSALSWSSLVLTGRYSTGLPVSFAR